MEYLVCFHAGANIRYCTYELEAIRLAISEANRSGRRVNVYPRPSRDMPCEARMMIAWPDRVLYEVASHEPA